MTFVRPEASRRRRRVLVAVVSSVVLVLGLAVWETHRPGSRSGQSASALQLSPVSTVAFFVKRFVRSDGRVVRTDQGGDTVSEGQAYGMLMTVALGDRAHFMSIWGWTRQHMLLRNGLLAWHWTHGAQTTTQSASDADLAAAAALVSASRRFRDPSLLAVARRLAGAILTHETAGSADGTTLVAGPWALSPTEYIDPSYLNPAEMDELASAFGGPWRAITQTSISELEALTARGDLPSDWAVVGSDHRVHPSSPPGATGTPPRFGFDAVRVPVWMAVSCSAGLRSSAAGLLPALRRGGGDVDLDLGGHADPGMESPVGHIPLAAAEWAAGQRRQAWADLHEAVDSELSQPTYYAAALVALTTLGFHGLLADCPGGADHSDGPAPAVSPRSAPPRPSQP